jgi:DNA mismatch repair ATPase MutS
MVGAGIAVSNYNFQTNKEVIQSLTHSERVNEDLNRLMIDAIKVHEQNIVRGQGVIRNDTDSHFKEMQAIQENLTKQVSEIKERMGTIK